MTTRLLALVLSLGVVSVCGNKVFAVSLHDVICTKDALSTIRSMMRLKNNAPDINEVRNGVTPLAVAIAGDRLPTVAVLLEFGADLSLVPTACIQADSNVARFLNQYREGMAGKENSYAVRLEVIQEISGSWPSTPSITPVASTQSLSPSTRSPQPQRLPGDDYGISY